MMSSEHTQLPSIGNMLRMTFEKWYSDNIPRHAAVLAFYALFAVAPILLLCVEILGLLYGHDVAEATVQRQVTSFVSSEETGDWVQAFLTNILPSSANWWVTGGFIVALVFGASSFFGELKIVLNQIWGVPFAQDVGIGRLLLRRLQAVLMVLVSSFLILFGFIATSWLSSATDYATAYLNLGSGYATWSYLILIFVLLTLVFALIYKFVPDVDVEWRDVWIGAAATALLLSITRLLISLYFTYSYTTTMFGAASALVVILLSVYYSAQIFFLGAEFTHIYNQAASAELGSEQLLKMQTLQGERTSRQNGSGASGSADASQSIGPSLHELTAPITFEVENIAPVSAPIAHSSPDLPSSESAIERTRSGFSKIIGRVPNPLRIVGKNKKNINDSAESGDRLSSTDSLPADLPTSTLPTTDLPTTDLPTRELTLLARAQYIVALPFRVLRPVREVIVAVGVIGALSLAALAGIPFWRRRGTNGKSVSPTIDSDPTATGEE